MGAMSVNLSIKDVPDEIAALLRVRARENHRSMQGELMAIVEAAVRRPRRKSIDDIMAEIAALGLKTTSESAAMIRADRDSR